MFPGTSATALRTPSGTSYRANVQVLTQRGISYLKPSDSPISYLKPPGPEALV